MDIDLINGKRIASAIEKSHGLGKVIFIHNDVSKHEGNVGKL